MLENVIYGPTGQVRRLGRGIGFLVMHNWSESRSFSGKEVCVCFMINIMWLCRGAIFILARISSAIGRS